MYCPCMSRSAAVLRILSNAQAELRSLLEQALAESRYTDVAEIAQIADSLAQLGAANCGPASSHVEPTVYVSQAPAPGNASAAHTSRGGRPSRSFPRFEREGDKLVKIAWSKKDRAEYEHKAPRQVVDLLIEAIRSQKGEGAKFEAPDVLPLTDRKARKEVPSYQSYLALAWLRYEGVVAKHGRDGYSLKPTAATPERLTELWKALPSRD
jgi:predicted lipid-binding transport protein (Tim44 family)